jgi:hypothetical protein
MGAQALSLLGNGRITYEYWQSHGRWVLRPRDMAGGSSKRSMASSPACGGVEVVGTQIGDDKCAEAGKEGAETSFSQIKRPERFLHAERVYTVQRTNFRAPYCFLRVAPFYGTSKSARATDV